MREGQLYKTIEKLPVTVLSNEDGEQAGTMTLPAGTVVQVDTFEPADPSVGIFGESIVFEVGVLNGGAPHFIGANIFVEPVDCPSLEVLSR